MDSHYLLDGITINFLALGTLTSVCALYFGE